MIHRTHTKIAAAWGVLRQLPVRPITATALIVAVAGCGHKQAGASEDMLRVGVAAVPPTIGNPYQGITIPTTLALQAMFDTVTTVDKDGNALPALATSWTQESPLSWVVKLRPDVSFANGEPLTAEALVVSAAHMASKAGRAETIGSTLYQIDSAERIDDLTVRIHLNEADPLFPLHIAVWRIPAPKQWLTLKTPAATENAVGSGPFMVAKRGQTELLLKANPRAWREASVGQLKLVVIPDATARLQAFVSGGVDIAMELAQDARASVEGTGGKLATRMTPQVDFLAANTERRQVPLADPRLRLAINYAVNREAMTKLILGGVTQPTGQLSVPGAFGYDPSIKPIPYDPARAKELLKQAGFAGGLSLTASVTSGEVAGDTLYYQQIGSDLKKVGINVEFVTGPKVKLLQDIFTGKIKTDLFNLNTRGTDPIIDYRHRACLRPTPEREPFHCDSALTKLLRVAMAEPNIDARRKLYQDVARYEHDNPPGLILWQRPDFDALSARVQGYAPVQDTLRLETWRKTKP